MDVPKPYTKEELDFLQQLLLTQRNVLDEEVPNEKIEELPRLIPEEDDDHHNHEENDLEWIAIKTAIQSPEAMNPCANYGKKTLIHPNYVKAGIPSCGKCFGLENIARRMVALRGWTFLSFDKGKNKNTVNFECGYKHIWHMTYEALRKGSTCKKCNNEKQKVSKKDTTTRFNRPDCGCVGTKAGAKPKVCDHYNHKVDPNGGAEEWDYEANKGVLPEDISPKSSRPHRQYRCGNEWCQMPYEQTPCHRSNDGSRCPYCAGQKVCEWNSLEKNYPELCKELDPENIIKSDQLMPGSGIKVGWLCGKHKKHPTDKPHRYETTPAHRIGNGSGCSRCNNIGGEQIHGGHEYFVGECNKKHGGKYRYLSKYQGAYIPVTIYCPEKDKHGKEHGEFLQTPHDHKAGKGCSRCWKEQVQSKLVTDLQDVLDSFEFPLDQINCCDEMPFPGLFYKKHLHVDRFVKPKNSTIEADGVQHFRNIKTWGGIEGLKIRQTRDLIKDKYFVENKINLIRIPYSKSEQEIRIILEHCFQLINEGKQIYVTYQHYYDQIVKTTNLNGVHVIIMKI